MPNNYLTLIRTPSWAHLKADRLESSTLLREEGQPNKWARGNQEGSKMKAIKHITALWVQEGWRQVGQVFTCQRSIWSGGAAGVKAFIWDRIWDRLNRCTFLHSFSEQERERLWPLELTPSGIEPSSTCMKLNEGHDLSVLL